jgi:hypothetical protein
MKDHEDPSSWIPIYSYGLGVLVCSRGSAPEPPEPPEPCSWSVITQTHRCRVLGLSPRTKPLCNKNMLAESKD